MNSKKQQIRTATKTVSVVGSKILYTLSIDGVTDIVDYDETLYNILIQECVSPYRNNGRLKFNVVKGDIQYKFYLYDLVMACDMGMVKLETFCHDMQMYYSYKSRNGLTVDHADNNVTNNTKLNLSFMDRIQNTSKASIVTRFKPPYYINSVFCGGEYRVQISFDIGQMFVDQMLSKGNHNIVIDGDAVGVMQFICEDVDSYVDCLKELAIMSYGWCNPGQTPKEHCRDHRELTYWAADVAKSIQMQTALASLDRDSFQLWSDRSRVLMAE